MENPGWRPTMTHEEMMTYPPRLRWGSWQSELINGKPGIRSMLCDGQHVSFLLPNDVSITDHEKVNAILESIIAKMP